MLEVIFTSEMLPFEVGLCFTWRLGAYLLEDTTDPYLLLSAFDASYLLLLEFEYSITIASVYYSF
jgi:hypothetical protein